MAYDKWYMKTSSKNYVDRLERYIKQLHFYEMKCRETPGWHYWVYASQKAQYSIRTHTCIKNVISNLKTLL